MFALAVELLSGRYVATAYNDRDRVEWPPHPARLFSALVATWAEGEPDTTTGASELEALRWLERQAAPEILASGVDLAAPRDVVPVFVPVNDVNIVTPPNRAKLEEAQAALAVASDPKSRARAEKLVQQLEQRLTADTARAFAAPARVSKSEAVTAENLVLDRRGRQPRTFPSATPACATVGFVWRGADAPEPVRTSLACLLSRLLRLGHSSSLVRATLLDDEQVARLIAQTTSYQPDDEDGELSIRWVGPGQADELIRAFDFHRETEPRVLPARFIRYRIGSRRLATAPPQSVFSSELIVFARVRGPRLPPTAVAGVARQMRRALMSYVDEPIPEVISGHRPDGAASDAPHLAVVPLPVVLGPHADGALLGIALALPREQDPADRRVLMRAIGRFEERGTNSGDADAPIITLHLGEAGSLELQRVVWGDDTRVTLQTDTWCRASRRWATATPIALDRNPGDLHHPDVERRRLAFRGATTSVVEAVTRIGLPTPVEIDVMRSCVLAGTSKPRSYPRFPAGSDRPQRVLVHARLVFEQPVRGPLLVGAGRYYGLGLFLPVDDRKGDK